MARQATATSMMRSAFLIAYLLVPVVYPTTIIFLNSPKSTVLIP